jgi:hypothetical protein
VFVRIDSRSRSSENLLHLTQFIENIRSEALDLLATKLDVEGHDLLHDQIYVEIFGGWQAGFVVQVSGNSLGGDAVVGAGGHPGGHFDECLGLVWSDACD